jgi:hypothetical protein
MLMRHVSLENVLNSALNRVYASELRNTRCVLGSAVPACYLDRGSCFNRQQICKCALVTDSMR